MDDPLPRGPEWRIPSIVFEHETLGQFEPEVESGAEHACHRTDQRGVQENAAEVAEIQLRRADEAKAEEAEGPSCGAFWIGGVGHVALTNRF